MQLKMKTVSSSIASSFSDESEEESSKNNLVAIRKKQKSDEFADSKIILFKFNLKLQNSALENDSIEMC